MVINMNKSTILINELVENVQFQDKELFPMNLCDLDQGVKYLGFLLKPNGYHYEYWTLLYKKVEARVCIFCWR